MSKYLVTWETDMSRWPTDPQERTALRIKCVEMTKQDMKEGMIVDWGAFVGGRKGYALCEGTGLDLYNAIQRYFPYYTFTVHEVLSIDELAEALKSLTK